ncbi:UNVERIFIED_CONTAM: hypothetical protein RMT77_006228 [Armadillidium vulgare]
MIGSRFILKYFKTCSFTHSNKLLQISKHFANKGGFIKMRYRNCSTFGCYKDKDPGPLFFSEEVQSVLKKLTGHDLDKIFKNRHLENPDLKEEEEFLALESMEEENKIALETAKTFLQMPPVIQERKPIKEVLSYDPEIQGLDTSNIIFTDISFGVSDRERLIVVREPNGILRKATWDERDRMNVIYNPRKGCHFRTPEVFEAEYLRDALRRKEYLFVLDFACAQFEPDDPKYQEVTQETFEHVAKHRNFDILHSTRHFGPMCFYFAWNKKINDLLGHLIENERIEDSVELIRLYYIINDNSKLSNLDKEEAKINLIKNFIKEEKLEGELGLIVQTYEEAKREREEYDKKLKSSHGIL